MEHITLVHMPTRQEFINTFPDQHYTFLVRSDNWGEIRTNTNHLLQQGRNISGTVAFCLPFFFNCLPLLLSLLLLQDTSMEECGLSSSRLPLKSVSSTFMGNLSPPSSFSKSVFKLKPCCDNFVGDNAYFVESSNNLSYMSYISLQSKVLYFAYFGFS